MNDFLKTYQLEEIESPFAENHASDAYFSSVFSYAVSNAVSAFGSYWSAKDAQKIIKEDTFNYIWNTFPDQRGSLTDIAIQKCSGGYSRVDSLSYDFCSSFLSDLYVSIPVNDSRLTNKLRARLVAIVDKDFDYLSELHKYSLTEDTSEVYEIWRRISLQVSEDENLYDYLWGKVKREQGATDQKQEIVKAALANNALSDSLIKRIAKSSPKRIKRTVVAGLREDSSAANRELRRVESDPQSATEGDIADIKEKLDKLEARAMLFVGCDDYDVVESLIDCLTRDNLPWLMPSASEHYWLSNKISKLIEEGEEQ